MNTKWFQWKRKKKEKTTGFYQQLYASDAHDFQWYQRQRKIEHWKIEHCDVPKKVKLAFEIGLPVNETQLSKITTKNDTFFYIS